MVRYFVSYMVREMAEGIFLTGPVWKPKDAVVEMDSDINTASDLICLKRKLLEPMLVPDGYGGQAVPGGNDLAELEMDAEEFFRTSIIIVSFQRLA